MPATSFIHLVWRLGDEHRLAVAGDRVVQGGEDPAAVVLPTELVRRESAWPEATAAVPAGRVVGGAVAGVRGGERLAGAGRQAVRIEEAAAVGAGLA
jgi:hypothetical protein